MLAGNTLRINNDVKNEFNPENKKGAQKYTDD